MHACREHLMKDPFAIFISTLWFKFIVILVCFSYLNSEMWDIREIITNEWSIALLLVLSDQKDELLGYFFISKSHYLLLNRESLQIWCIFFLLWLPFSLVTMMILIIGFISEKWKNKHIILINYISDNF